MATYDKHHRAQRKRWLATIQTGQAQCTEPTCLKPNRTIHPDEPWDLAHNRTQPGTYHGPAHTTCNRTEGAQYQHGPKPITWWPPTETTP